MAEEIEESAQTEEENIELNRKKARKLQKLKDESSVTFFLHGALFMFFTTAFTFLFFLYKNRYPLILNDQILPEVLFSSVGLLIVSLVCLFLLSFWRLLGRAFLAAVTGACGAYVLGLVYPDNVGVYLGGWLPFLPRSQLMWLAENGNFAAGCVIGAVLFVFLNICKGAAMAFLSLPVLAALLILLNTASKQVSPQVTQKNSAMFADEKSDEKTQNLIYLILADHGGYKAETEEWKAAFPQSKNPVAESSSPAFINAFYQSNGFTFYPSAYLRFSDRYRNVGAAVNPSLDEVTSKLFSRDDASYYVSSSDARVFLLRNDLFKAFKDKDYKINVYQTYPFDFCTGFESDVEKCVTYPAPLGALYQTDLSVPDRVLLLVGHFLNSMPAGKKAVEKLRGKPFFADFPFIRNPLSHSLPVGQAGVLHRLVKDAESAKGKNVFFAHLNLPHYPYMYDENCKLVGDPMQWRSRGSVAPKKDLLDATKNRQAYMRQLACAYGQLNYMLNDLKDSGALKNTKIVIHGDRGDGLQKDDRLTSSMTRIQYQVERLKRDMTTVFAVYDPAKSKASVETGACDVQTLVNRHVLDAKDGACLPPDIPQMTDPEKEAVDKWLAEPADAAWLKKESYAPIYAAWREKGGQAFMARVAQRQQQADKSVENAGKMTFVAPPAASKTDDAVSAAKDAPDFVPVPDSDENVPPPAGTEAVDDEFADLPQPIAIPETTAEEKWKTLDAPVAAAPENAGEDWFGNVPPPPADANAEVKAEENAVPEAPLPPPVEAESAPVIEQPSDSVPPPNETPDLPVTDAANAEKTADAAAEVPAPAPVVPPASDSPAAPAAPETQTVEAVKAAIPADVPAAVTSEAEKQAEAKASAEERTKAAEEKARAEAEAAEEKARAEAELRAKIEAEVRAKLEAEAKAKAAEEARLKAEAEAKLKAEEEAKKAREAEKAKEAAEQAARIQKAIDEANAKQKAAEEARLREEAEAAAKKAFPPAEQDNTLDITHEILTERTNEYGDTETYIFIERKPNPNRYDKKYTEKELQSDLIRVEPKKTDLEEKAPEPQKQVVEQPAERVLGTEETPLPAAESVKEQASAEPAKEQAPVETAEKQEAVEPAENNAPLPAETEKNAEPAEKAAPAEPVLPVVPEPVGRELTD